MNLTSSCGRISAAATVDAVRLRDTRKDEFLMLPQSTTCTHPHRSNRHSCVKCYLAELRREALATLPTRFWSRVDKSGGETACWIWRGATGRADYGVISVAGRGYVLVHRLSYELTSGPIPKGLCICHHCDTPLCVNPAHLFLGTHADNMHDRDRKGRTASLKKTHCPAGHPYNSENTYCGSNGKRTCRICHRVNNRHYAERKKR